MDRKLLLKTAGYCSIVVGLYLIHLGHDGVRDFDINDDVIDAEFEVYE